MPMSIHGPPMERVALELGYISIYWGWIEDNINEFITALGPLERGNLAQAIVGNTEIRSKIQMAKAIAFLRKPNSEWFVSAIAALDTIDNDLRNRRNAFIHAGWYVPKGRLMRHRIKTKLKKPQAFQIELSTQEIVPIKIGEARKLRKDMLASLKLVTYLIVYAMNDDWAASKEISFSQFLRLAPLLDRRRRAHSERERQQRSSSE
jgi:hypothetical protein